MTHIKGRIKGLPDVPMFTFMGVRVNSFTMETLTAFVDQAVDLHQKIIIANHNLHSLALIRKSPKMAEFYGAAHAVHIDGMALVMVGRLLGLPITRTNRITYVDWMPHLMAAAAEKKWRICYVGSKPGVGEASAAVLRRRFKGLDIVVHQGYFNVRSAVENGAVLDYIMASDPAILMVGMGMPRQEEWIWDNLFDLPNSLVLPCGAALDYAAGIIPTPPRWAGRIGMEWLYRLMAEPGRMWYRYLAEPWRLVRPFVREWRKRWFDRY